MTEKQQVLLIVLGIIAGLLIPPVVIGWWLGRRYQKRYWTNYSPLACPSCGTKYMPRADKGWRELDGPVYFEGHVFECQKCGQSAGFAETDGMAEFAGYLDESGYIEPPVMSAPVTPAKPHQLPQLANDVLPEAARSNLEWRFGVGMLVGVTLLLMALICLLGFLAAILSVWFSRTPVGSGTV